MSNKDLSAYLQPCDYIDFNHASIVEKAKQLSQNANGELEVAKACFEFVRDDIKHSWDYQAETLDKTVSIKASEVLGSGHGFCYAKSHLLAALLRANNIPSALCYQRLTITDKPPYCLHGLNAVYLNDYGWYKIDARGNKPGVDAQFNPPQQQLAFPIRLDGEKDFSELFSEPMACVIEKMQSSNHNLALANDLPDLAV